MTIEPTAIIPPGGSSGGRNFYNTYNTRYIRNPPPYTPQGPDYSNSRIYNLMNRAPNGSGSSVTVPSGVPRFLGARPILMFSWIAAMAMVCLDEWHTYHILPRPARLWDTTATFLLLGVASTFDVLVPIINIFAIGLVIQLGYQYYTGTGQFGSYGAQEANANV